MLYGRNTFCFGQNVSGILQLTESYLWCEIMEHYEDKRCNADVVFGRKYGSSSNVIGICLYTLALRKDGNNILKTTLDLRVKATRKWIDQTKLGYKQW